MKITRHKKTVTREDVNLECDWCHKQSKHPYDWGMEGFYFDTITVSRRKGYQYPESGSGTLEELDLCPACWEKLLALLKTHGVAPTATEWGY
jgi:hypothetical protein